MNQFKPLLPCWPKNAQRLPGTALVVEMWRASPKAKARLLSLSSHQLSWVEASRCFLTSMNATMGVAAKGFQFVMYIRGVHHKSILTTCNRILDNLVSLGQTKSVWIAPQINPSPYGLPENVSVIHIEGETELPYESGWYPNSLDKVRHLSSALSRVISPRGPHPN